MACLRISITAIVLVGLLSGCDAWNDLAGASGAHQGPSKALAAAIDDLPVAAEQRDGYDRDAFSGWNDADGDGCDTRDEVLIDEDMSGELGESDCDGVMTGEWVSIYDDTTITESSQLDIDHFVPLAEAWDSGASQWSDDKRDTYATYLDDDRHLVAVTAGSNRSKGDKDPAEWLPTNEEVTCEYLATWVAIKTSWALSIDQDEHDTLIDSSRSCGDTEVHIRPV